MQYALCYNEKTNTLTIKNEDQDKPLKDVLGHIYYGMVGEIPDAASHPEPRQHMINLLRPTGVPFERVTVKNATDNDKLDKFAQEGVEAVEADKTVQVITKDEDGNLNETELRAPEDA